MDSKKLLPMYIRRTTRNNQMSLPKEYIRALIGENKVATFKVTLNKSRKTIKLELME
jgi:hypothetical protein